MQIKNKFLFVFILFIITFLAGQFQHELSHKVIYLEAACDNIHININFPTLTTSANCNLTPEMNTALFIAQANVEANYEFQRFDVYFLLMLLLIL